MAWFEDIPRLLADARPGLVLSGLPGGAGPLALAKRGRAPGWVIVPTREDADRWVRALHYFGAAALLYPADDTRPWDGTSPDPYLPRLRLAALAAPDALVVAPAKALLGRVPRERAGRTVAVREVLDRDALLRWLVARGYLVTQKVEDPATVAMRGGNVDVWPAGADGPVRLDLFDDEVESISPFDPDSQRLRARRLADGTRQAVRMERVQLLPAREAVLDEASAARAAAYLHALATETGATASYRRVIQDLRSGVWFPGAEEYLPALEALEVVPVVRPLFVVEPERVQDELAAFERLVEERHAAVPADDRPLVRPFDRYAHVEEIDLSSAVVIERLPLTTRQRTVVGFGCRDNRALHVGSGALAPVVQQLRAWAEEGRAITIVVEPGPRVERVRALFEAHGVTLGAGRAQAGELRLDEGELPEGFQSDTQVMVTAAELFGDKLGDHADAPRERSSARFRRATRASFASVKRGDFVVHAKHGIGLYVGLARMPMGVGEGDFVVVEYRDGEKLYVPVHRLDLVAPYRAVGTDGQPAPKIDRLGGATWEARKAKVRDAVLRMASELLLLYARQKLAEAPEFDHHGEMYVRFEEAFPYVETPDQETAIRDVLEDLASGRPMDRLLVGDVGFGKTEVAMRAAFCVVHGGAQVAVLCPTSVLALQHGESFRRRYAGFPVRVEVLSRLRPPAEEREVRQDLTRGTVDVVIGTTKLLSRDLRFRKLGLVVVDEEHRFGTRQKEELKRLFAGVHTLALSATPIPRTLQMALSGIRSLSVLATPPIGRQRIRTEVVRFSADRIREDILYELRRGGQVYFVHNRVQSIGGVARWLARLVPEASFVVAHGQMAPDTLERALTRFIRNEANVLVSTAIIESGIDLPLVNTMIINRAELFGMAQLYQLRGRIGRGNVRGHCTVLVAGSGEDGRPAVEAKSRARARVGAMERLRVLVEHDELGSNFALATRDLELRGSGEILGDRQHGQIAAIGFDAYLELLDEAVARAKGEVLRQQIDPEVEVSVSAVLPEVWIPDLPERLDAYQRLALCRTRAAVRAELASLEARFEEAPPEARNLAWHHEAGIRCRELGIERFAVMKVRAVVRLHESSTIPLARLADLCTQLPNRFKRLGERELEVRFTPDEAQLPFRVIDWTCTRLEAKGD